MSLADLKDIAGLLNVLLIPVVCLLWTMNLKLALLGAWKTAHDKNDDRVHTEVYDRIRTLELKDAQFSGRIDVK